MVLILSFYDFTGDDPKENEGTLIRIKLHTSGNESGTPGSNLMTKWKANITSYDEKDVTIRVEPPADAMVGEYKLYMETIAKKEDTEPVLARPMYEKDLILLFNPWCSGRFD